MQVNEHRVGDPAAKALAFPDVYFADGYGAAEEEVTPVGSWRLLEAFEGLWQLPVMVHRHEAISDCSSPYGYAGAYAAPSLTASDSAAAWREARAILRERGVVSMFVRRSPLVKQADPPPDATWVVRDHPTRALDLTGDVWAGMQGRCRTSIRKATRSGLNAEVRSARSVDLEPGSPFRLLYEAAMARREAADRYYFPDSYYQRLLIGLGDNLLLGTVFRDTQAVAAALFMRHDRFIHYHLSGGAREAGSLGATNLLLWEAVRAGKELGARVLHLGGGVRPGDSLYAFKRSFGGRELDFSAYGLVLDRAAYDVAVAERAAELKVSLADLRRGRSFPAYRGWGAE